MFFCLQLYIWSLKNNQDLIGIAFIDTQIYIHRLVTLKSLILAADVCKSISVVRFEAENRTISLVSKVGRAMSGTFSKGSHRNSQLVPLKSSVMQTHASILFDSSL